ncbi:hexitol phosphatase HxpB [Biostraticola tofi]|uniref:Sugar-phosphatase n=1 Tax=Biostraticola tofi TaxID=466109 RepID=A0A4R3Z1S6_9GAMM|nr:hexitol phosphatase HxpB [Biostraticola tofi]TCV99713.1 sugar-phosphatase [Biostraticola tofi]
MQSKQPQEAVIFDMDGLIVDSEPLWAQAEMDIFSSLGTDPAIHASLPDTLGLRIDVVVDLWYQASPWSGPSREEVTKQIIRRVMELIEIKRQLLPGVEHALDTAVSAGLKIGMASASPRFMLEEILEIFQLGHYFTVLASAQHLPYSKPHPQVYLQAAAELGVSPARCTTLEDSINGMIATKAARMRSIVVPDVQWRDDPLWVLADIKLPTLGDLLPEHLV